MTKAIVLTHTDLDGVSCGILFQVFAAQHPDFEVQVTHCTYPDLLQELEKAAKQFREDKDTQFLFITDCMFPQNSNGKEILDDLYKSYPDKVIKVIDHHSTALWANQYPWASIRQGDDDGTLHCATYWVGEYLKKTPPWSLPDYQPSCLSPETSESYQKAYMGHSLPHLRATNSCYLDEYILLVDLWDTWRWKNYDDNEGTDYELAKDLNSLLHVKGTDCFINDILKRLIYPTIGKVPNIYEAEDGSMYLQRILSDEDTFIIDLNNNKIKRLISTANSQLITGTYTYKILTRDQLKYCLKWYESKYGQDDEKTLWAKKHFKLGYCHKFKIGIIFCKDEISSVCHGVLSEHPELDFIIDIAMPTSMSFRSDKDLEVPLGIIANRLSDGSGGGHEKASACSITNNSKVTLLTELLGDIILSKEDITKC